MTIKLLTALTFAGSAVAAGEEVSTNAALEAELVQRGVAEYVEGTTFSPGSQQYTNGAAHTLEQGLGGGEDVNADTQRVSDDGDVTYISTATTTLCATGRGTLKRIVLTETAAGLITVYDNVVGSGTVLGVFKASIAERTYELGWKFNTGCTIVTAAASKLSAVTGK